MIQAFNRNVIAQHAESAAILWLRRDFAVRAPHYRRADLKKLDEQLVANLDGLRIPGDAGWQACVKELRWKEPGEVFSAAVLAMESGRPDRIQKSIELAAAAPELARSFVSAMGWLPWRSVSSFVARLLASADPVMRCIGVAACAAHRREPGQALADGLHDSDGVLRARALRAAGQLGRIDLLPAIREHHSDAVEECRFAAAWSSSLMASDGASAAVLKRIVESRERKALAALQLVLRRMGPSDAKTWLLGLAATSLGGTRLAIIGAGALGEREFIPWLIEKMKVSPLARVAGEAFAMIAGVDIAYQSLDRLRPEGFESGPSDDPADENVEMDADENLPWPDREKIADWWKLHSADFTPGMRYLLGKPIAEDWLEHVLCHGYQRQRAAAALELAIRRPGTPLFEVRALASASRSC